MLHLLHLIAWPIFIAGTTSDLLDVSAEVLPPVTNKQLVLKVSVKNLSDKTLMIPKQRNMDYKREKIRAIGNFIIEVQQWENNKYRLIAPSADIDPSFPNPELVPFKDRTSIKDSITIKGRDFSQNGKDGFPPGKYRVRVYFNTDRWNTNEECVSDWLEFDI